MPTSEITSCDELKTAIDVENKSDKPDTPMRHYLIKRGVELGCVENIPDEWTMEVQNG